jgi:hypothetical protein
MPCLYFFLLMAASAASAAAASPPCMPVEDSRIHTSRDTCLAVHVYHVVTLDGGLRFLDVCSPETSDEACHFSIVSYPEDRDRVGDLKPLQGQTILVRGAVQKFGSRLLIVLNDQKQLHGGQQPFRPDPRLLNGFSAEDAKPADAPELRVNFHHHGRKLAHE